MTEWRFIDGFPGYLVSDDGVVASLHGSRPRFLRPSPQSSGYMCVALHRDGQQHSHTVHRLVLEAFRGPRPDYYYQGRHLDGDRTNNRLSNLAWGTPEDNYRDKLDHGTATVGERNASAKLTAADVYVIRQRMDERRTRAPHLARRYGVSATTIRDIYRRRTWTHLGEEE